MRLEIDVEGWPGQDWPELASEAARAAASAGRFAAFSLVAKVDTMTVWSAARSSALASCLSVVSRI